MANHIRGGHVCMPPMKQSQDQRLALCESKGHRWIKCGDGRLCGRCNIIEKDEANESS